ncbi:hypothetical protein [Kistimonas asteriae]|uniref:hypothetical protein n=1 Tax=Kistimonas asteriae TaxID=517724 RepID=UPI001BAC2098|nr:hypothetical protein [Kistimonas asteriae]
MPLNRTTLLLYLFLATPCLLHAADYGFRHGSQPLAVHHYSDLEALLLSGQPVRALINYQFCECDDDIDSDADASGIQEEQSNHHRFIASVDWRTFYLITPDHNDPDTHCLVTFKHNFMNTADLNYLFDNDATPDTDHEHTWIKLTVNYAVCSDTPEQLNFHMSKRIVAANNPLENGMLYPQATDKSRAYGHCPLNAIRFYRN